LEEMNKNIVQYNDGLFHQPIYKARIFELGSKFSLGKTGNKKEKYVEAAKGTNLFFAIYKGKNIKGEEVRLYDTIPLDIVIERQKQGLTSVPVKHYDKNGSEYNLIFSLSPNDLVYVLSADENENFNNIQFSNLNNAQKRKIYKMEKASGTECYFIPNYFARLIKQYDAKSKIGEMGSQNKLQTTVDIENSMKIIDSCVKLKVNRLGIVEKASK